MNRALASERELEVLHAISFGASNGDIGRLLHISEDTVKSHVRSLMRKVGVRDRAHLVRIGFELGLLTGGQAGPVGAHCGPCRTGPPPPVPDLCAGHRRLLWARLWASLQPLPAENGVRR